MLEDLIWSSSSEVLQAMSISMTPGDAGRLSGLGHRDAEHRFGLWCRQSEKVSTWANALQRVNLELARTCQTIPTVHASVGIAGAFQSAGLGLLLFGITDGAWRLMCPLIVFSRFGRSLRGEPGQVLALNSSARWYWLHTPTSSRNKASMTWVGL